MALGEVRNTALSMLSLVVAGCAAGAAPNAHSAPPLPGTEACIFTVNLFDWTVLDDTTLIVYAPLRRDPYLLKLFEPVVDLPFRETLGFEAVERNGQLCKGDYVVLRGEIPRRVVINSVRALTPAQAKELIAAAKSPAVHGAPPSAPAAGDTGKAAGI